MALVSSKVSLEPMVLEVRKVMTMLEECCPWYIFTAKIRNATNITANFEKSHSKISHFRPQNLKKVLRNPGGTETFYNASSKLFSVHQFSSITCWLSRVPSWRGGALVSTEMRKCCHTTSVGREETRQKVGVARGAWHPVESTAGAPPTRSHFEKVII